MPHQIEKAYENPIQEVTIFPIEEPGQVLLNDLAPLIIEAQDEQIRHLSVEFAEAYRQRQITLLRLAELTMPSGFLLKEIKTSIKEFIAKIVNFIKKIIADIGNLFN